MWTWTKQADVSYILSDFLRQYGWAIQDSQGRWTWGYFGVGGFGNLGFDADEIPPPLEWPWPPNRYAHASLLGESAMLSIALFNAVYAKLVSSYESSHGQGSSGALPWAQIIAFIMSLLGGVCPKPPTPAAARKQAADNPFYLDYATRTALIQEYGVGAWRKYDGPGMSAAVKGTIATGLDDAMITEILESI